MAVQQLYDRPPGRPRVSDRQRLASGLAWLSLGLGLAALLAPRPLGRAIGAPRSRRAVTAARLVGAREVVSGLGILASRRPAGWLWARTAGDAMDLALLAAGVRGRRARPGRLAAAMTAVAGVAAVDAIVARHLSRRAGAAAADSGHAVSVRRAVTVNAPREQLYAFWRDLGNMPRFMQRVESVEKTGERRSRWRARVPGGAVIEWESEVVDDRPGELIAWRSVPGSRLDHAGSVRFKPAPGGRGTEVIVDLAYTPPGGILTATLAKVIGQAPEQQLQEDLRRFKQLIETGTLVHAGGVQGGRR